jgi:PGF-pre-PGF domain-containing protein
MKLGREMALKCGSIAVLLVFLAVAVSPAMAACAACGGGGGGGGKAPATVLITALKMNESTDFEFPYTAVNKITVTPGEDVEEMRISVEKLYGLPTTMEYPDYPIFQLLDIQMFRAEDSLLDEIRIEFLVDCEWLELENMTPDSIVLLRYIDGEWVELPTGCKYDPCECPGACPDQIPYIATTPGFSYYAIVAIAAEEPTQTPVPTEAPETVEPTESPATTEPTEAPGTETPTTTQSPLIFAPALALPLCLLLRKRG